MTSGIAAPVPQVIPPAAPGRVRDLRQAAQQFAALFLHTLLRQAFRPQEFPGGGGPAQEAFYDQLNWEYARVLAQRNDAGIAKLVLRSLHKKGSGATKEK